MWWKCDEVRLFAYDFEIWKYFQNIFKTQMYHSSCESALTLLSWRQGFKTRHAEARNNDDEPPPREERQHTPPPRALTRGRLSRARAGRSKDDRQHKQHDARRASEDCGGKRQAVRARDGDVEGHRVDAAEGASGVGVGAEGGVEVRGELDEEGEDVDGGEGCEDQ